MQFDFTGLNYEFQFENHLHSHGKSTNKLK